MNIVIINIIKKIAKLNICEEVVVESIINQFSLLRSANICGKYTVITTRN